MVLVALPGWIEDNDSSVRREVAEWIGTSAAERWRLATLCCRDAIWAARASGDPQRVLDQVDPLPPTTVAALARLRRAAGWGDRGV